MPRNNASQTRTTSASIKRNEASVSFHQKGQSSPTLDFESRFLCGDCEEVMKRIPSSSIDLVFTSPPYADQRVYDGKSETAIPADEYLTWFSGKAQQIYRVLKETGSFVLNINDKVIGKFQDLFVFELVIFLCKEIGFHLVRDYIWYNPATPPNSFSKGTLGRTKKSHEYCFWFSKGDTWTFNLDPIRKPYSSGMKQVYLKGLGKGERTDNKRPSTHSFNCQKMWKDNGGADPGSVLELSVEDTVLGEDPGSVVKLANTSSNDAFLRLCRERNMKHPARFPIKLADFFILSGSNPGDVVLDPFSGSGTTAVSALRNKRRWIGIDYDESYCSLAKMRVDMELHRLKGGA